MDEKKLPLPPIERERESYGPSGVELKMRRESRIAVPVRVLACFAVLCLWGVAGARAREGADRLVATTAAGSPITPPDPVAERREALLSELARDRAAPRALVPLIELRDLEDALPDLSPVARAYAEVVDDERAHPEVRAYARLRLADLERSRGNLRKSEAELAKLGFLAGWQIAGPFDNEGKRGFQRVDPPERAQDLSARFQGKVREVGWRELPPEALNQGSGLGLGFADLGAVLRPSREVVAYALTVVEAPRALRARLYLGASGAVKVFVNGALVYADPSYHAARFDQAGVEFALRPGPNRLLLKICQSEGPFGFFARLTDHLGAPLQLPVRAPPLPPPRPTLRGGAQGMPVPGVLAALERRAQEAKGLEAALAHRDLAIVLAERRPGEDRERRASAEARRAAELAPHSLPARLLAAQLEEDQNRRRAQLEAAVQDHPQEPVAIEALARFELMRGHLVRARRLLEGMRADLRTPPDVRLASADLDEQAGFSAKAWRERASIARDYPFYLGAVLAAARAARAQDRLSEAALLFRKALALRFDDANARGALVQLLLDRADLDGALALLEEQVRLQPSQLATRLRWADLLAANGRLEAAEAVYAVALRIAPDEPEILERRGQARLRAGRAREALVDFQAALDLKPQNPRLKELVSALEPARERFEEAYMLDARALAASAPRFRPEDDAVVLGETKVTKVFPSGLSSTFTQLAVKVLTARGVDAWRSWATAYVPGRQELRIERARVIKPNGAVSDAFQESERSTSEPWYRLYYDTIQRQVTFPALAPGDLLELAVRVDDVASENLLSDYFGEITFFGDTTRKVRSDYVLLVPEGRRIYESAVPPGVVRSQRTLPGGVVERRWSAREVARLRPEPGMPGPSESVPYVHVSTYASWEEVGRFYWGLIREQLALTPEVRQTASAIAAEVRAERRAHDLPESGDALALVQAVHRFVVTNTRYVGLEFGIHGFKPYRVDQILERRFGDCKDKASLTHALLEALGIDSRLVLLRMKRLGTLPENPASLAVFNHAILYVPRFDLWLDGTASYSGSRDLPAEDRGASVLVVNPDAPARLGTIPEGRPEDNLTVGNYEVSLAADGSAVVNGEARVSGVGAPMYRSAYAAQHDRRSLLEQAMSSTFPGLTVKEIALSDLSRLEDAVSLRFSLGLPHLAQQEGRELRFQPFGAAHRYAESIAPLSTRRFDLVLGQPWETRMTYRYALPMGFDLPVLPPSARLDLPFGTFQVRYRIEESALLAEVELVVKKARIRASEYPAFRDFLSQLDRAMAREVRIVPRITPVDAAVSRLP